MSDISPAISLAERLKHHTSEAHKRLESTQLSLAILSDSLSKETYADYLRTMLDVVRETEAYVFPLIIDVIDDLPARRKAGLLKSDLLFVDGKSEGSVLLFDGPMSVAFALGVMYVVEGSSLGGRFILKNVEKTLGFNADKGASYFSGYGDKTGSMWKKLLSEIEDYALQTGASDEILAGANFAFETIEGHFNSRSHA